MVSSLACWFACCVLRALAMDCSIRYVRCLRFRAKFCVFVLPCATRCSVCLFYLLFVYCVLSCVAGVDAWLLLLV